MIPRENISVLTKSSLRERKKAGDGDMIEDRHKKQPRINLKEITFENKTPKLFQDFVHILVSCKFQNESTDKCFASGARFASLSMIANRTQKM